MKKIKNKTSKKAIAGKRAKKPVKARPNKRIVRLENKHLGNAEKGTGIYAKKSKNGVSQIHASGVTSADSIKLLPKASPGSKYDGILARMNALKPGQAMTFPVPHGQDARAVHNRFNSFLSLNRKKIVTPAGCMFKRRVTADSRNIAIICAKKKSKSKAK